MIQFVTLVHDEGAYGALLLNLGEHGGKHLVLSHVGAKSITSGYNKALADAPADFRARADILCFIHQDARLHFDFDTLIPDYFNNLQKPGVLGFVGCGRMGEDSRWWVHSPRYGSLIQGPWPAESEPNLCFDPPAHGTTGDSGALMFQPVESVDGYCLFVQRKVFEELGGFDEQFDKWHCYDADLCMSAIRAGYRNYVIGHKSQHYSGGSLADPWATEDLKWRKKWAPFLRGR